MKKIILLSLFVSGLAWSQPKYVTTIHPFVEILKAIVAQRGEVYGILPPGASPHTYELRPSDLRKVEMATAFFYGAENLDAWALKFQNANRIGLLKLIPQSFLIYFENQKKEPQKQEVELEALSHDHHGEGNGIDPHFWTDPLTVKALLPALTEKLGELDPEGFTIYRDNSNKLASHLDSLHTKIADLLAPAKGSAVMITHPFYQYFFKRYGIRLVNSIEKNPGREPTPKEISEIITQAKRAQVKAIIGHVQLPERAATLVAEAAGLKVYRLDPLGGVPGRQSLDEILLYNTKILVEALR